MRDAALIGLLALAALACGKEKNTGPSAAKPEAKAQVQEQQKEQEQALERQARVDALRAKRDAAKKRVAELERAYKTLIKEGDAKRAELPDIPKLRRRFVALLQDRNVEASKLRTMEKRFAKLRKLAESRITGELKRLRAEQQALDKRYEEVHSGWLRDLEEANQHLVEESPVKRDLDTLRKLKTKWLEASQVARAGRAGARERGIINDGFRSWLAQAPARGALVERILSASAAAKGKTEKTYDFTKLDFYVLLEMFEDDLDRRNIAVEKKVLTENYAKLAAIQAKLDALREKIAQKMQEGGGELEEFDDLQRRLPGERSKVAGLEAAVTQYGRIFNDAQAKSDALDKAEDDADQALRKAKQDLRDAIRALREFGG